MVEVARVLQRRRAHEDELARDESAHARRSRTVVTGVTLVVGAGLLAWALRVPAGDPLFYPATLSVLVVWLIGARLSGPPRHGGATARDAGTGAAVGLVLLVVFLIGAVVVARIPLLREPVLELLAHATQGSVPVVLAITVASGIAEEVFFRGALYDALLGRRPVLLTSCAYLLVTAAAGIPLLALAGALLGVATALLRRLTRGILAPTIAHLVWSVGMFLLLGPTLTHLAP